MLSFRIGSNPFFYKLNRFGLNTENDPIQRITCSVPLCSNSPDPSYRHVTPQPYPTVTERRRFASRNKISSLAVFQFSRSCSALRVYTTPVSFSEMVEKGESSKRWVSSSQHWAQLFLSRAWWVFLFLFLFHNFNFSVFAHCNGWRLSGFILWGFSLNLFHLLAYQSSIWKLSSSFYCVK